MYIEMLKNLAVPQVLDRCAFQQNWAPPHYCTLVTKSLNKHFGGRWISCGSTIP
jgi:hypothetical protein